ncbi:MAG: succinate dehydrogenase/fumarate reductase iron-sulfur subunit [Armatimonadetes bacterium]|nr:succinate dehydrogenase/fumarate reductase iron-sulfur subunit [Armatimonadota bacterium]
MTSSVSSATITLEVLRYRPGRDQAPAFQSFQVPYREDWVVLDALNYIKDQIDGSLSYRWSCRMGVCGSCGMMVNGTPRLSCAAFLKEYYPATVRVEPLEHFPIERDLVISLDDFMQKLPAVRPWIVRQDDRPLDAGEYRQTPAELDWYKQFSMCINCLLCYSACPVYELEPRFIGPAALALVARYNLDSRDQGREQRQEIAAGPDGVWDCTLVGECSTVCPKDVDPAGAIQRLKLSSALEWVKNVVLPWGRR